MCTLNSTLNKSTTHELLEKQVVLKVLYVTIVTVTWNGNVNKTLWCFCAFSA